MNVAIDSVAIDSVVIDSVVIDSVVIDSVVIDTVQRKGRGIQMKTVMGWIDKIVSSLARRKVNKDEGRTGGR
jgi:hypothetical protein